MYSYFISVLEALRQIHSTSKMQLCSLSVVKPWFWKKIFPWCLVCTFAWFHWIYIFDVTTFLNNCFTLMSLYFRCKDISAQLLIDICLWICIFDVRIFLYNCFTLVCLYLYFSCEKMFAQLFNLGVFQFIFFMQEYFCTICWLVFASHLTFRGRIYSLLIPIKPYLSRNICCVLLINADASTVTGVWINAD